MFKDGPVLNLKRKTDDSNSTSSIDGCCLGVIEAALDVTLSEGYDLCDIASELLKELRVEIKTFKSHKFKEILEILEYTWSVLLSKQRMICVYYKSDSRLQLPLNCIISCFLSSIFLVLKVVCRLFLKCR
ncbi:hypothetical protein L1987_01935 [Smallanthus sonchifolius]|uniref:Uncharacterized protein n=1 Tax=Smallanthus sonchifolius TaxID=185202 RepID=A0ACB9K6H8_9ASTR|nr:hypothetical protein L1987_01935 [Smallanthus sonchifolius]